MPCHLVSTSCRLLQGAILLCALLGGCSDSVSSESQEPQSASAQSDTSKEPTPQLKPKSQRMHDRVCGVNAAPSPVTSAGAEVLSGAGAQSNLVIDHAVSLFVDPVKGSNSATGTEDNPVQTIRAGLSLLSPGMTLYLRGGEYNEQEIPVDVSGSEAAPITIRNYPGERVVINASVPKLRSANAGNWELVEPAIGLYRSLESNFGDEVFTGRVVVGSTSITLVPYYDKPSASARGLDDLSSTVQDVDAGARYVGPGIYNSSGTLFVRLEPVTSSALQAQTTDPLLKQDAEAVAFEVSGAKSVFNVTGSWLSFHGLVVRGARIGFDVKSTASELNFSHTTFHVPGIAIVLRDNAQNIRVNRCLFDGNFPDHVAWTDMKGGDGQSMPASHWAMKAAGISANSVTGLTVSESLFHRVFDGLVVTDSTAVHVQRNSGFFIDDMAQIGSDSSNVYISDNYIEGAGPSHYGQGDSSAPGTTYISGNIIDSRAEILWGKRDPAGLLRPIYSGWRPQRPFQTHTASALLSGDPWKIYHNTVVFDSRADGGGVGFSLWKATNKTGAMHEVLNNVFVNHGDGPFAREVSVRVANQYYDGNLYWRVSGAPAVPFDNIETSVGRYRPSTFDEYISSTAFAESAQSNPNGWEANGVNANPDFTDNFRPSAASPAASGAILLGDESPIPGRPYRGAVAP